MHACGGSVGRDGGALFREVFEVGAGGADVMPAVDEQEGIARVAGPLLGVGDDADDFINHAAHLFRLRTGRHTRNMGQALQTGQPAATEVKDVHARLVWGVVGRKRGGDGADRAGFAGLWAATDRQVPAVFREVDDQRVLALSVGPVDDTHRAAQCGAPRVGARCAGARCAGASSAAFVQPHHVRQADGGGQRRQPNAVCLLPARVRLFAGGLHDLREHGGRVVVDGLRRSVIRVLPSGKQLHARRG